jgi:hypothetical protein
MGIIMEVQGGIIMGEEIIMGAGIIMEVQGGGYNG